MASFTKLASGKYRVRVRVNGQYRGLTFTSKAAARRWALNIESQLTDQAAGVTRKVAGMTVGDLVRAYIDEVVEMPRSTAGRTKRATLRALEKRLATVRLESLQDGLDQFIIARQKDGAGGVTIAGDLSTLSTVLRWAARIKKFALASGMRQGEICRIKIEDIDWERKTVLITDRKDPKEKIGNDQIVPLLDDALALAKEQAGTGTQGRLFPYNSRSVSTSFQLATNALGIEDLRFHDCRHYAATSFFKMGLPIELVALITGHKSWENLRRYTQLTAVDVHDALQGGK